VLTSSFFPFLRFPSFFFGILNYKYLAKIPTNTLKLLELQIDKHKVR
jgi:hypothetical protein